MQVQIDIKFDDLLKIVKILPAGQLKLLKAEIEKEDQAENPKTDLEFYFYPDLLQQKSNWKLLRRTEKRSTSGERNNNG